MRNHVGVLLAMLAVLCFSSAEAADPGDDNSPECRIIQQNAQDLVDIAIDKGTDKKIKSIVKNTVNAAELAGYILDECVECIISQFDNEIAIPDQEPCGPIFDKDGDGWDFPEDCDDDDPEIHPGALWSSSTDPVDWNCDDVVERRVVYRPSLYIENLPIDRCSGEFIYVQYDLGDTMCGEDIEINSNDGDDVYDGTAGFSMAPIRWNETSNECRWKHGDSIIDSRLLVYSFMFVPPEGYGMHIKQQCR